MGLHISGVVSQFRTGSHQTLTAAALREHIGYNGLLERVTVVERAISGQTGRATFHVAGVDGMSRLGRPNPVLEQPSETVEVPVDTLDSYCARAGIVPAVIMMDIEGFEIAALSGAVGLLSGSNRPVVAVELHPDAWPVAGNTRADLESLLARLGIRAVPLTGQTDPLGEYGQVALE